MDRINRAAFLGVESSLTGRRWAARLSDERAAQAIAQRHGLPDAIARLLAARDIALDDVQDFLEGYADDPDRFLGPLTSIGLNIAAALGVIVFMVITATYIA